jgi:hypothetical protein
VGELAAQIDDFDKFLIGHGVTQVSPSLILQRSIIEGALDQMNAIMRVNSITALRLVYCGY